MKKQHGSAMPLVLFFAAIGMITVFTYMLHQMSAIRPSIRSQIALQALFNARSGVYHALYQIVDSIPIDTFETINTLDSVFGSSLFDVQTDTAQLIPELDGIPVGYSLFSDSITDDCQVSLQPAGGKCKMISIGIYHSISRTVEATLGCPIFAQPDTVALYYSSHEWNGNDPQGTVIKKEGTPVYNSAWYNSLIDRYLTDLTDTDTLLMDPPLTISSTYDITKINSVVNGPLLIDGSGIPIRWKDTSTYIIKSDLQITGDVECSDMRFIVAGEIKLLDEANVSHVDLFTSSRLFIGDNALYSGNALALHSITVYGKASIIEKSSLIAGSNRSSSGQRSSTGDSLKFSIILAEEAEVDAVCIALETPGSIKTGPMVSIKGILWAHHLICHRGEMSGLLCANRLVDCEDPVQMVTNPPSVNVLQSDTTKEADASLVPIKLYNTIPGILEPLDDINSYTLPFFMGRLSIVHWKEL